ncbi:hypothetical protein J8V57_17015 [Xenorhabdus sp. PB61.4]|uniref:hypothetical protein n=1 Tax=Xenorhabdus sp. PB61.4 TaxID=2788940 RepID=UPI001E4D98B9|nr:hypothetical protein [Xenorhabdus sp. PB61.4]MCC8367945.1 hypothetical protein [Xenorhabdus sp. PB61.4]
MKVTNRSSNTVSVSINAWGDGGSTDWFKLDPGGNDSWDRSDYRGFVMAVITPNNGEQPYFIYADSSIYIYDDYVEDYVSNTTKTIYPATQRYGC